MYMTQQAKKQMLPAATELIGAAGLEAAMAFVMSFPRCPFMFPLSSAKESAGGCGSLSGGVTQSSFLGNLNTYRLCPHGVRTVNFLSLNMVILDMPQGVPGFTEIVLSALMCDSSLL